MAALPATRPLPLAAEALVKWRSWRQPAADARAVAGAVNLFALNIDDRPRDPQPSGAYTHDYNEAAPAARTTASGLMTTTPTLGCLLGESRLARPAHLAQAPRTRTSATSGTVAGLCQMAGADAITAWDTTATTERDRRPVTAIHEGDNDGNPRMRDSTWVPVTHDAHYPARQRTTAAVMRSLELSERWLRVHVRGHEPAGPANARGIIASPP